MSSQPIDYEVVLRDLGDKRRAMNAQFDAAIAAIRQVLVLERSVEQRGLPGLRTVTDPVVVTQGSHKPYRSMSIVAAAKAHLDVVQGPVPNPELARALEAGGFKHKSKNFTNTLNSVLRRQSQNVGDVRKDREGWQLVPAVSLSPDDAVR